MIKNLRIKNLMIKKFIFLLSLAVLLEGCSIWPYKSDFDCPIPEGNSCRSLYEINQMADLGDFSIVDTRIVNTGVKNTSVGNMKVNNMNVNNINVKPRAGRQANVEQLKKKEERGFKKKQLLHCQSRECQVCRGAA